MSNTNHTRKAPKKDELSQLITRNLPYWPYFLLSLVICSILGVLYLHFKTPVYQASATLLIKDNGSRSANNEYISPLDVFSSQKTVENETGVLTSYNLMERVVKKLDLYAPVTVEGKLRNQSAYVSSPIKVQAKYPDSIIIPQKENKIYFRYHDDRVTVRGVSYPLNTWESSPWGIIRFIPNPEYQPMEDSEESQNEKKMYFSLLSVNQIAHGLIGGVNAEPSGKLSSIIQLKYNDRVPERARDILNVLISYYNMDNLKYKNKLANNMIGFLDERIKRVKYRMDSIENTLQLYKSSKGGVGLDNQSQLILNNLSENDQKISEINVQLATLEQIKEYVNGNGGNPGIIALSDQDQVLSSYLEKLYEAELKYDRLKKTTAENNATLLSLKDQINRIKPTILQYVNNRKSTLEITKGHLQSSTQKYNARLSSIPQKQRTLLEINRKQKNTNDLYNFLLEKKEKATLSSGAKVSDIKIIDQAVISPYPVSPKKPLVMGMVLLFGFGIPFILLKINEKVLTKEEVKELLDAPILGEIAKLSSKEPYLTSKAKYNLISEQFRQLRISLAFAQGVNTDQNKIMVTSSISGEGKSFVAANLAINLTSTGKKVLLIDLDLHQPTLDQHFDTSNEKGVSDYLLQKTTLENIIIRPEKENNNLYLIPSGEELPNPSEMLLNGKISELLSSVEEIFDYIVIDTAPVNIISDAYHISDFCDTSVFVVRYKYTPKSELKSFKEHSDARKLKNMGIIFNGIKSAGARKYRKTYYHYVKREVPKKGVSA